MIIIFMPLEETNSGDRVIFFIICSMSLLKVTFKFYKYGQRIMLWKGFICQTLKAKSMIMQSDYSLFK